MKRGAIGLSINTLVVIIISLVILGLGVSLLYQFIADAEDIKGQLDRKTEEELERLLVSQGQRVALPLHTANIYRGESHSFGIGILNTLENNENFRLIITFSGAYDENQNIITDSITMEEWLFSHLITIPISRVPRIFFLNVSLAGS